MPSGGGATVVALFLNRTAQQPSTLAGTGWVERQPKEDDMRTTVSVDAEEQVRVCCVFLCHDERGRLLLHRRTAACRDEAGTWDCGGGALEFGEDLFDAVRREVREEYGAPVRSIRSLGVRNVLREHEGRLTHWVAAVFDVLVDPARIRLGEPDKMAELGWFDRDHLPAPLHSQLREHLAMLPRRPLIVEGLLDRHCRRLLRWLPIGISHRVFGSPRRDLEPQEHALT
jgi:8-oxo-dGTP diphosphatase